MFEAITEATLDSVKLVPFLFVTYLVMGLIERAAGGKAQKLIRSAGKVGPIWGGILGVIPQCGFSAAASYFYIGRVINLGTLIAIYLATSDEMLPVMISEQVAPSLIAKVLVGKAVIGMISGFAIEFLFGWMVRHHKIPEGYNSEGLGTGCSCGPHLIVDSVVKTLKVFFFIWLVSIAISLAIDAVGHDTISHFVRNVPVLGEMLCALVGLIPNCAASVVITELYLDGVIGSGAMMSGLLCSAGVGLLVLFRENKDIKQNLKVIGILYAVSVIWGIAIEIFVGT